MKVQQTQIENEMIIQIFINKEEIEKEENIKKIEEIQKENKKIVMFMAGDKDTRKTLLSMLQVAKDNDT